MNLIRNDFPDLFLDNLRNCVILQMATHMVYKPGLTYIPGINSPSTEECLKGGVAISHPLEGCPKGGVAIKTNH